MTPRELESLLAGLSSDAATQELLRAEHEALDRRLRALEAPPVPDGFGGRVLAAVDAHRNTQHRRQDLALAIVVVALGLAALVPWLLAPNAAASALGRIAFDLGDDIGTALGVAGAIFRAAPAAITSAMALLALAAVPVLKRATASASS